MMFDWSLNPYMGCAHRCTFCYVRAFERRADRPSDEGYGRSIRVKINVAEVLRSELARRTWHGDGIAIGAATDPYQPAEGRYKLTRACLEALPGLSDHPQSLERVVVAAREAGACGIWANLLYLRPGTREHFLECLARDWPELLPDYERLYERGAYLPRAESEPARAAVRRLAQ